jgi:hypothetical protein
VRANAEGNFQIAEAQFRASQSKQPQSMRHKTFKVRDIVGQEFRISFDGRRRN